MLKQREMPEDTTVCWASGHYLTNELPDNWMDMDEADVLDFIEEHTCEDYEFFLPERLFDMMTHLAEDALHNKERIR